MAIKRAIGFSIRARGDGSSSTLEFVLAASPFWFLAPAADASPQLTFDLLGTAPTSVVDVYSPSGSLPEITAFCLTTFNTKLSVTFASAPANNLSFDILGTFIF